MNVCIFEDSKYVNLQPLTYFRPVFELRCGASLLWEKFGDKFMGEKLYFITRDYLAQTLRRRIPFGEVNPDTLVGDDLFLINGRWLYQGEDLSMVEGISLKGDDVVCGYIEKGKVGNLYDKDINIFLSNVKKSVVSRQIDATIIEYPWDLIKNNPDTILSDFKAFYKKGEEREYPEQVVYGSKEYVYIAKDVEIHPYVILDTTQGPIIVDEGAILYPFSRIEGPAYIGKNTFIVGGKIREGTSIGPVCRIGGEVEETIIQGYTNKWHDGFLGHSYVCEWVNIGAMATNSDLKNNYSDIKVLLNGEQVDTKDWKVGSFIGDHTKLGIGTLLNTGSIIGVCANIFGSTGMMPPKFVPSFSWGSGKEFVEYRLEAAINTAKVVLSKRDVTQTEEDIELIKNVFTLTINERKRAGLLP